MRNQYTDEVRTRRHHRCYTRAMGRTAKPDSDTPLASVLASGEYDTNHDKSMDQQITQLQESGKMTILSGDTLADIMSAAYAIGIGPKWLNVIGAAQEMTLADVIASASTQGIDPRDYPMPGNHLLLRF